MLGIKLVKKMVFGNPKLPKLVVGKSVQFIYNGHARNLKVEWFDDTYVGGWDYNATDGPNGWHRTFLRSKMTPLVGRVFLRR